MCLKQKVLLACFFVFLGFWMPIVSADDLTGHPCYSVCSDKCRELAFEGDPVAQYYYGDAVILPYSSCGMKADDETRKAGFELIVLSAESNYELAINRLGFLYLQRGDVEKAEYWYEKGSELGNRDSKNHLSELRTNRALGDIYILRLYCLLLFPPGIALLAARQKERVRSALANYALMLPAQITLVIVFIGFTTAKLSSQVFNPKLTTAVDYLANALPAVNLFWGVAILLGIILPFISILLFITMYRKALVGRAFIAINALAYFGMVALLWIVFFVFANYPAMQGGGT